MTIDPRDLKTLLVRITLITLAVRAVPLIAADLTPHEAALALGGSDEWMGRLYAGWASAIAGTGFLLRLPALLSDLALPLLAVAYARAAGWGSVAGLLAGLVLAMAPFGIESGYRADLHATAAALALVALWQQRLGLRDGDAKRIAASAGLLVLGGWVAAPVLLVVPAGVYQALRAVTLPATRWLAAGTWSAAAIGALGARLVAPGWLVPTATPAQHWLAAPALAGDASGWHAASALDGIVGAISALLTGSPWGPLARQLDIEPAPLAATAVAGVLALAALWGAFVRGIVQPEKQGPTVPAVADADGAGASDGWRALGVGRALSVPRELGDRDTVPHLLVIAGAMTYLAQAAARGVPDGVAEALATARPSAALLIGVGFVGWATARLSPDAAADTRQRRRFIWTLAVFGALVFAGGALHLVHMTQAPERMAARKVARYAREEMGENGALLALGRRGLPVQLALDPWRADPRVCGAALESGAIATAAETLLARKPRVVVVAGDRDALGDTGGAAMRVPALAQIRAALDVYFDARGYAPVGGSHRFLDGTAVVAYESRERSDPTTIIPPTGPAPAR
jgi:hypothetical protein